VSGDSQLKLADKVVRRETHAQTKTNAWALTELTDVVVGGGLGHGGDGEEGAAVPRQGLAQDVLPQIDLGASQALQLGQMHLPTHRGTGEEGGREGARGGRGIHY